jgi:hypothetical protein
VSAWTATCVRTGQEGGEGRREGREGREEGGGEGEGGSASVQTLECVRMDGFLPPQIVKTVRE